jgi:hypothetical protein
MTTRHPGRAASAEERGGRWVRLSSAVIGAIAAAAIFELPFDLIIWTRIYPPAFFCLALMLLVFAVWALAGFGCPSAPVPFAMNLVSKIIAFVTALSLFFPEWFTWWRESRSDAGGRPEREADYRVPKRRASSAPTPHGVPTGVLDDPNAPR